MPISPDDAAYCDREVRAHDPGRWLTALFAPDAARPGFHALLAFAGELSRTAEVASQPMLGEIRLQWWREALDEAFAGTPRAHPVARALAATVTPTMRALMDGMIDARAADLYETPPIHMAELEHYASATDGALAEVLLSHLGFDDPEIAARARKVGAAFGLASVVRTLPAALARRRLPLPADWLAAAGTDPDRALAGLDAAAVTLVGARVAEAARALLAMARSGRRTPRAVYPVMAQARLAARDLKAMRRQGVQPIEPAALPWQQLSLLIGALSGRW